MLTIGEFSRLGRVSRRMLRHYDALGLLCPEAVGENGYRYYRQEQLSRLLQIQRLQSYGFSLSEVGSLLELSEPELARRLYRRRIAAYEELNALREKLRQLEQDILRMEGTEMEQNKYQVTLREDPAQTVFGIRRIANVGQLSGLFEELFAQAPQQGFRPLGPVQFLYHSQDCDFEAMDVETQVVVAPDPKAAIKPAQFCAVTLHKGPYAELQYAYNALNTWLAENPQYHICGPAIERYLNDPTKVSSQDELETEVLFPVERE